MSGEAAVTTRNVNKANALAKSRERRRELGKARDEQDRRVEQATATALVALDAQCPHHIRRTAVDRSSSLGRARPGELVHMDVKKLGKIPDRGGWRVS
jgi:hypothetical protein